MASQENNASDRQLPFFSIDALHDPLMIILDQIPIMERIRLERVCRSAGSVVAASLRRVIQLDFSQFAQIKGSKDRELQLPNGLLSGILRRFREHVRSLKFREINHDSYSYDTTREILSALIQFQPFNQLQKLYLDGLTIDESGKQKQSYEMEMREKKECENSKMLQQFFSDPSMKSLRVLDYGDGLGCDPALIPIVHASCIQSVLKNCRNLEKFKMPGYSRCFQLEGLFPESVESIGFYNCLWFGAKYGRSIQIDKLFGMRMPSLQRIEIECSGEIGFGSDSAANFPNLKVLELGGQNSFIFR